MKNERYYLYQLAGGTIRFKNILRKKCGKLEPMIQMEIMKGSKWLPMLRCDRSHSFLHIDLYDCRSGKKTRRDLSGKDACSAIVEIVGLLKQDWRKLFEELHCYKIIDYFTNNRESLNALDDARTYLLNEAERPHSLVGSKRKGANAFSNNASLRRESEDLTCTKKK